MKIIYTLLFLCVVSVNYSKAQNFEYGKYSTSDIDLKNTAVRMAPKKLIYTREFVLNSGSYGADQYEELVKFVDSASTSDSGKIVFKNN